MSQTSQAQFLLQLIYEIYQLVTAKFGTVVKFLLMGIKLKGAPFYACRSQTMMHHLGKTSIKIKLRFGAFSELKLKKENYCLLKVRYKRVFVC